MLQRREFAVLYELSLVDPLTVYRLLFRVQMWLFLPVTAYLLIMMGVGYRHHWYLSTSLVLFYNLFLCLSSTAWYLYLLKKPVEAHPMGRLRAWISRRSGGWDRGLQNYRYRRFLFRYILTSRKVLLLVIKLYNCGILYLIAANWTPGENDRSMIVLFYSFGVLGHGVLIHRMREMEETQLSFYRGLPVKLTQRLAQYGWFYFIILLPEVITIVALTPAPLHYPDAAFLIFFSWAVLLLLNSLLLFRWLRIMNYLKVIGCIFFVTFLGVLTGSLTWLCLFFFLVAVTLFFSTYYKFER
jgi:hypothetical protein